MTGTPFQFQNPAISIYSHDLEQLVAFYERLGFIETWRVPSEAPVLVVLELDAFKLGVTSVEAAITDHGLEPDLGGRSVEIVLWTDDVNRDYAKLTADGAPSLSPPHDFLGGGLRAAWIADPDGNPIQLVQRN